MATDGAQYALDDAENSKDYVPPQDNKATTQAEGTDTDKRIGTH
jgi:hypothetical protein